MGDPSEFLRWYCDERGISAVEDTTVEQACVRRAELARERFKKMRATQDVPAAGAAAAATARDASVRALEARLSDNDILTPAQKYTRRLVNNRKSAAAARVFQEVLKKEQAHTLRSLAEERDRFAEEKERIAAELLAMKERVARLQRENERMAATETKVAVVPAVSSAERTRVGGPVASASAGGSQRFVVPSSRNMLLPPSLAFSPSQGDAELKLFHGLPNSQSQSEDVDEKAGGTLMRAAAPVGSAVHYGLFSSQASQGCELPANLRCSIGSEDIADSEGLFFLGSSSQGFAVPSSQGRTLAAT